MPPRTPPRRRHAITRTRRRANAKVSCYVRRGAGDPGADDHSGSVDGHAGSGGPGLGRLDEPPSARWESKVAWAGLHGELRRWRRRHRQHVPAGTDAGAVEPAVARVRPSPLTSLIAPASSGSTDNGQRHPEHCALKPPDKLQCRMRITRSQPGQQHLVRHALRRSATGKTHLQYASPGGWNHESTRKKANFPTITCGTALEPDEAGPRRRCRQQRRRINTACHRWTQQCLFVYRQQRRRINTACHRWTQQCLFVYRQQRRRINTACHRWTQQCLFVSVWAPDRARSTGMTTAPAHNTSARARPVGVRADRKD